jgi:predicted RNase H-like HicB family nuclease
MELPYTYWEGEDGWLVGYLNENPEHWTQGKDIKELEEMLFDLYENFQEEAKLSPSSSYDLDVYP